MRSDRSPATGADSAGPEQMCERLVDVVRSYGPCIVAYSGGVDSAVVAKAAQLALGGQAIAVTGVSASLATGELESASQLAARIGIRHEVLSTDELTQAGYVRNAPDRCYHCKVELYTQLGALAQRFGTPVIVNGANADDLGDYRPGMIAASEHQVKTPLAECGFTKGDVRQIALHWNLPVWDKPATPCLSSRVAYGEEVTPERLKMIDQAEALLRSEGFTNLRVRFHRGEMARIEVTSDQLLRLCEPEVRVRVIELLKALGFKYVTLDLEGFRSGSQNAVLPIETLSTSRP